MGRFQGSVAVVTGAGRGIGREIARRFCLEGAKVAVVSRGEASAAAAVEAFRAEQPDADVVAYAADVADGDALRSLADQIASDLGPVRFLINNAGITRDRLTARISDDAWDEVLATNLKGAFLAVKAFARPLLKTPEARIINVSSVVGLIGNVGQANYVASKAGLLGLTKSLAKEFASRAVTVNAIAPGFIRTDMTEALGDEQRAHILDRIPLGTFGEVSDVAAAVLFLCSPEAGYITGQVLVVDGGMVM